MQYLKVSTNIFEKSPNTVNLFPPRKGSQADEQERRAITEAAEAATAANTDNWSWGERRELEKKCLSGTPQRKKRRNTSPHIYSFPSHLIFRYDLKKKKIRQGKTRRRKKPRASRDRCILTTFFSDIYACLPASDFCRSVCLAMHKKSVISRCMSKLGEQQTHIWMLMLLLLLLSGRRPSLLNVLLSAISRQKIASWLQLSCCVCLSVCLCVCDTYIQKAIKEKGGEDEG